MNPLSDAHSIAVIGSGSWATAIVKILTDSNKHVYWHVRSAEDKAFLQTEYRNKKYLKQLQFQPGQYTVSCDLNEVISKSKWVVFALPSHAEEVAECQPVFLTLGCTEIKNAVLYKN